MTDEETILRVVRAADAVQQAHHLQHEAVKAFVDAAIEHHTARILAIVESVNTPERRTIADAIRSMPWVV